MDKPKRQISRRTQIVVGICSGIVTGLSLPAALWCINLWWSGRQVEQELARIRAAGEPVVWEDLGPLDHEGAGHVYAAAFNLLALEAERRAALEPSFEDSMQEQANQSAEEFFRSQNEPQPPRNDAWGLLGRMQEAQQEGAALAEVDTVLIDQMLDENQRVLSLLHEAAAIHACRFVVVFNMTSMPRIPLLREAREASYLLLLQAGRRQTAGNVTGAVDSLIAAARIARISRDQPIVVVHYVGRSIEAAVAKAAAQMLSRVSLSSEELERLQIAMAEPDDEQMFRRSILAERLVLYYDLDELSHKAHDPESPPMMSEPAARKLVRNALRDRAKVIAAAQQPWPGPLEARNIEPEHEGWGLGVSERPMWMEAHWMNKIRAAITAIAIERYRREHQGALPSSLAEMVPQFLPAVPLDPMTGRPLLFKRGEASYTVYGTGNNREDDGGEITRRNPDHAEAAALDWGVEVKTGGR